MSYRYPATQGQRDSNESEIISSLQAIGATVEPMPTGGGVPDLLVGYKGDNFLMEVKPEPVKGKVFASDVKLNPKQVEWHKTWKGQKAVVRTPQEALAVLGIKI
jgi:hypothetical protein